MGAACYKLTGELVAVSPLHVGSGGRVGIVKQGLPFIPGSFIRGAVGAAIVKLVCKLERPLKRHEECKHFEECAYTDIFSEETGKSSRAFFRYAYPLHLACEGGVYLPVPKTYFVCKNPQCKKLFDTLSPPTTCDRCPGSLKQDAGFVCSACGDRTEVPVQMGRVALTAVDRVRGSAAVLPTEGEPAGTLHALDVIGAGSRFRLEVVVSSKASEHLELLEDTLREALPEEGIGGSKSRGLGKVVVENLRVEEVKTEDLERRAKDIDASRFTVELISPTILEAGKPLDATALLGAARRAYSWCFKQGEPELPEVKLVGKRFSFDGYSGWSLKEDRRRRVETAISPGSVFQFESAESDPVLGLALASLELHAVGGYKPHGCGQIRIGNWR
jgi:CRISPR/Cas system CSM-associated protein Csm3 (group 7 of RAMP superfamily)